MPLALTAYRQILVKRPLRITTGQRDPELGQETSFPAIQENANDLQREREMEQIDEVLAHLVSWQLLVLLQQS
jgi:hypothetical protein